MSTAKYRVESGKDFKLKDFKTGDTGQFKNKKEAKLAMRENIEELKLLQEKLYAQNKYAVLIIFQAMDAAGKDSTIEHVMSGINPQGCEVYSFKKPSPEEMDHSYLWRCAKREPQRGRIGIFNRSYYEEVLVVKVHDLLCHSQIPLNRLDDKVWDKRYRQIRDYESYLYDNGIIPIKFFLNVSKEEQRNRFIKRIDRPEKNWKFSMGDVEEREHWQDYQDAYQSAIAETATEEAPWYVIPADHKWYMRYLVSHIIVERLKELDLHFPVLPDEEVARLGEAKRLLLDE